MSLVGRLAAGRSDLAPLVGADTAAWHVGGGGNRRSSIDYAVAVAASQMDAEERAAWATLSCFPAGLGEDEIGTLGLGPFAIDHVMRLYHLGLAVRAATGLRVPQPLRLAAPPDNELWAHYASAASAAVAHADNPRAWLIAHQANLALLAERRPAPDGLVDLGCDGLLAAPDARDDRLQATMARLVEAGVGGRALPRRVRETIDALSGHDFAKVKLLAVAVAAYRRHGDQLALADTLIAQGDASSVLGRSYIDAEALLVEAQEIYEDQRQ